jgi:hypothetical protein
LESRESREYSPIVTMADRLDAVQMCQTNGFTVQCQFRSAILTQAPSRDVVVEKWTLATRAKQKVAVQERPRGTARGDCLPVGAGKFVVDDGEATQRRRTSTVHVDDGDDGGEEVVVLPCYRKKKPRQDPFRSKLTWPNPA